MPSERLCLLMPVFNEAVRMEGVCRDWLKAAESLGVSATLLIVDDGSTDGTASLLDRLAREDSRLQVIHQRNAGHGAAIRTGYVAALATGFEWIFQTDSDGQFSAGDLASLWRQRAASPFLLGCRAHRHDPVHRLLISRTCRWLLQLLFGVSLLDPNVPYRLMRKDCLARLLPQVPPKAFAPNIFLSLLAAKEKQPLLNLPVTHHPGKSTLVSFRLLKACAISAKQIAVFRLTWKSRPNT